MRRQRNAPITNGFVYILLNPAFPQQVKIGRTLRDPQARAMELSRQTGVPDDFIVLYDALVQDPAKVERLLHERFAPYRHQRNKEFFQIAPKDAIVALRELETSFAVTSDQESLSADLLPHFRKYFQKWLDPSIVAMRLVQMPGVCFLELTRQPDAAQSSIISREPIPLLGLVEPREPTLDHLRMNEAKLRECDAYDWLMIADVFPQDAAAEIATEWEKPGGRLAERRARMDS